MSIHQIFAFLVVFILLHSFSYARRISVGDTYSQDEAVRYAMFVLLHLFNEFLIYNFRFSSVAYCYNDGAVMEWNCKTCVNNLTSFIPFAPLFNSSSAAFGYIGLDFANPSKDPNSMTIVSETYVSNF